MQTQEGEDIFNKVMQEFQEREQVRRNRERAKSAKMYRDNQIQNEHKSQGISISELNRNISRNRNRGPRKSELNNTF